MYKQCPAGTNCFNEDYAMSIRVLQPPALSWIGIDVSDQWFDFSNLPPGCDPTTAAQLKQLPIERLDRTRAGAKQLLEFVNTLDCSFQIVMESTGRYSSQLASWMLELDPTLCISIVNPRRVNAHAKALGMRHKTDPIDARVVASYGLKFRPKPWQPQPAAYQTLQMLLRTRQSMVEQRTACQNHLDDLGRQTGVDEKALNLVRLNMSTIIDTLDEQIAAMQEQIEQTISEQSQLSTDAQVADSIPGVGDTVSATLFGEIGDVRRFHTRRELETYVGMNVGVRKSGTSMNTTIGLCKQGSSRVRRCLFLAAMAATRGENALARHYCQLIARGKAKKAALASVMRKILALFRRLIINQTYYQDHLAQPKPLKKAKIA